MIFWRYPQFWFLSPCLRKACCCFQFAGKARTEDKWSRSRVEGFQSEPRSSESEEWECSLKTQCLNITLHRSFRIITSELQWHSWRNPRHAGVTGRSSCTILMFCPTLRGVCLWRFRQTLRGTHGMRGRKRRLLWSSLRLSLWWSCPMSGFRHPWIIFYRFSIRSTSQYLAYLNLMEWSIPFKVSFSGQWPSWPAPGTWTLPPKLPIWLIFIFLWSGFPE